MIHEKHKTRAASLLLSGVLPILLLCIGAKAPEGRERAPGYDFRQADALIEAGIARKELPGAVLVVGHGGRVVYRRAYGDRAVLGVAHPTRPNGAPSQTSAASLVLEQRNRKSLLLTPR